MTRLARIAAVPLGVLAVCGGAALAATAGDLDSRPGVRGRAAAATRRLLRPAAVRPQRSSARPDATRSAALAART